MRRFAPCFQRTRGVTGPLPGSRVESGGMFCPRAPGAAVGDLNPIWGAPDPYSGGPIYIRRGHGPYRVSRLRAWGFGTCPWGSRPVAEVP
jgi:hypothetical protein